MAVALSRSSTSGLQSWRGTVHLVDASGLEEWFALSDALVAAHSAPSSKTTAQPQWYFMRMAVKAAATQMPIACPLGLLAMAVISSGSPERGDYVGRRRLTQTETRRCGSAAAV